MNVKLLSAFLLLSSSLLFSAVVCDPNHHHNHHNDFPWQNILSALGIVVENQTESNPEPSGDMTVGNKEYYTSESTVEILKSETKDGIDTPIVVQNEVYASESTVDILKAETTEGIETPAIVQNGINIGNDQTITYDYKRSEGLPLGFKIGIPIFCILIFICFWYIVCRCCHVCVMEVCCCGCCETERPGVIVMQNTAQNQQPAPAAPQIILQQPIIHQQAPPMYDAQQRWAQPHPQGPPQGPPQWAPHPMGQQQQYSPHSGYDNAGFNPATAPPPYNPGKY